MTASRKPFEREEIELKLEVEGPEALERLKAAALARGARALEPSLQVNHFFDSAAGHVARSDRTVRLRSEDGRYRLTLKGARPRDGEPDVHARIEEEVELSAAQAEALLRGERAPLAVLRERLGRPSQEAERLERELEGAPLVHAGSFENERTTVGPLHAGGRELWIELDRTSFPGGRIDCEVELELPRDAIAAGRAMLVELFAEAGVEGRPTEGKITRFFRALAARKPPPSGQSPA